MWKQIYKLVLALLESTRLTRIKWACRAWRSGAEIRVSMASLVRIGNHRLLLVNNNRRPEVLSAPGGVIKFDSAARTYLSPMEWRDDSAVADRHGQNDLRGFLYRRNIPRFIEWFESEVARESDKDAALREVQEEIPDLGARVRRGEFCLRKLRSVWEGPNWLPLRKIYQLRFFSVFELADQTGTLAVDVEARVSLPPGATWVEVAQLSQGRLPSQKVLGSNVGYLVSATSAIAEPAPLVQRRHSSRRES